MYGEDKIYKIGNKNYNILLFNFLKLNNSFTLLFLLPFPYTIHYRTVHVLCLTSYLKYLRKQN